MFSKEAVAKVSHQMQQVTHAYEQLFNDFGIHLYQEIAKIENSTKQMEIVYERIDEALQAFAASFPNPNTVACQATCAHCCSFAIECPPQVITHVAEHIQKTFTCKEIETLKEALHVNIKTRKAPHFRALCPFLNEANLCSIYEVRPLTCRWFSSPDAVLCERSTHTGESIPQRPTEARIYQMATTALVGAGKKEQVEFIPALFQEL